MLFQIKNKIKSLKISFKNIALVIFVKINNLVLLIS